MAMIEAIGNMAMPSEDDGVERVGQSAAPADPRDFIVAGGDGVVPGLAFEDDDEASEEEGEPPPGKMTLTERALTTEHLMCHRPYNKCCPVCRATRSRKRPHMRRLQPVGHQLTRFGEVVTCDHIVAEALMSNSIEGHMYGVVLYDLKTKFMGAFPALTKTGAETLQCVQ